MKYFSIVNPDDRKTAYDEWNDRLYDYVFFSFGRDVFNEINFSYILVDRNNKEIGPTKTGKNHKMFLYASGMQRERQEHLGVSTHGICKEFNNILKECKFTITHDFVSGSELLTKEIGMFEKQINFDQTWCTQKLTEYKKSSWICTPLKLSETHNLLFKGTNEEESSSLLRLNYIREIYFELIASAEMVDPFHPELIEYRE